MPVVMIRPTPLTLRVATLVARCAAALLAGCGDRTGDATVAKDSVTELRDALRRNPEDYATRLRLARVHLAEGDGGSAESHLRRVLDADAGDERTRGDLARSLLMQGKYFKAREVVEELVHGAGAASARDWMLYGETRLAGVSEDPAVVRNAFIEAFRRLIVASDPETSRRLDVLTGREPIVASARAHVDCHHSEPPTVDPPLPGEPPAAARILRVGPGRDYETPSAAARDARDGDIVEIDAVTYRGDVAVWRQSDLTLRGVGGIVRLEAAGQHAQGKGIWVFAGDNITAENIGFFGAKVPNKNGAGIKLQGKGATIRNCVFRGNENGILGGSSVGPVPGNDILIEFSTFEENGQGDGLSHNIYVGQVNEMTLRFSYSRAANKGHLVKSRALRTAIVYNRLIDEFAGQSSYVIDLPEGGESYVVGNEIHQGPNTMNPHAITYAEEMRDRDSNRLFVVNNTIWNSRIEATIVRNDSDARAVVANNLVVGVPALLLQGPGTETTNVSHPGPWLQDMNGYDFRLTAQAPAIDAATPPREFTGIRYLPEYAYRHPARGVVRRQVGPLDVGAHEFCGF